MKIFFENKQIDSYQVNCCALQYVQIYQKHTQSLLKQKNR